MDKTIENKFFEAFKFGGVVHECIDWVRYTYNLPPMKPNAPTEERGDGLEQREADEKWDKYYKETLPKEILEATEAFDDVTMSMDSPLMSEIEANLNDCQTDAQREKYLFSLLKPFGESGCNIARVYVPIAELNQLKEAIDECEKGKAYWQTVPENEQLKNANDEPVGTPKEQIEACDSMCKRYQEQIDWVLYVNRQFIDLTCTNKDKEGSVERCLGAFVGVMKMYANRLDALLLTYGIDLLRLQRESGLYLKSSRQISDIDWYMGSSKLAQKYIDALPKEPQPEQTNNRQAAEAQSLNPEPQQEQRLTERTASTIPTINDTNKERFVFGKALEKQYMHLNNGCYEWTLLKSLLAYMCGKLYCEDFVKTEDDTLIYVKGKYQLPAKRLESLFGVNVASNRHNIKSPPRGWQKVEDLFKGNGANR